MESGFDVLLFDYRGYGESQGDPEISGVMEDIESAFGYALRRSQTQKLIVVGQSLGASLGIYAVGQSRYKKEIQAFVAVSAFSSYQEIAREVLARSWLTWLFQWPLSKTVSDQYSPIKFIADVSPVPLIVAHSPEDEIIPWHHAVELFAQAREPKALIKIRGGHNEALLITANRKLILRQLEQFLSAN